MECWFGREESDTRLYRPSQSEEDRKLEEIIMKLFQELVQPAMSQSAASTPTHQALATQPRQQRRRRTNFRANAPAPFISPGAQRAVPYQQL